MPLTTRTVAYADQDTALTGELYWDAGAAPRPGILLIHGGAGLDDHARGQASRYAALGYVVFACDMLGDKVAGDRARVIGSLTAMRDDPRLLAGRAQAGLAELAGCGLATEPFAAVGFCFGGLAALTLARSGAGAGRRCQHPWQPRHHPPRRAGCCQGPGAGLPRCSRPARADGRCHRLC